MQVFVGSFRGGKRGGSRTAHLKAAASDTAVAETDLPETTWRSSRPRSRANAQPADTAPNSRQSRAQPRHEADSGEEEAEEEEEHVQEEDAVQAADEEEEDIDEEEEGGGSEAVPMDAEESGELMFEAEVVDALATLPSSQPQG